MSDLDISVSDRDRRAALLEETSMEELEKLDAERGEMAPYDH